MTDRLIVIVPTRSRPHNVAPVVESWRATHAFEQGAELVFVVDQDDPALDAYADKFASFGAGPNPGRQEVSWLGAGKWRPLVPKLDHAAEYLLITQRPYALGFAGDDHRPRTDGWVAEYLRELHDLGTGVVSCSDGYRGDDLPTQWAMTSDIVEALGRMVPAPVEHLYCDDAVRELARAADCYRFRADLVIDHLNPWAGQRAPKDPQYERVNSHEQYAKDRPSYRTWKRNGGLAADAEIVRKLRQKGTP